MSTLTWITEKELEREIQNKGDGFRSRGSTLSPQVRSPFAGAHLGTKGEPTKGSGPYCLMISVVLSKVSWLSR